MKEIEENLRKKLVASFKTSYPKEFKIIKESWHAFAVLSKYKPEIPEIEISEVQEKLLIVDTLLSNILKNISMLEDIFFPLSDRQREINDSWNNVDWLDACEILEEVENYTDPSTIDNMTLEEALKLIEEHNPSFVKAKREELAAQNSDNPDLSQPT